MKRKHSDIILTQASSIIKVYFADILQSASEHCYSFRFNFIIIAEKKITKPGKKIKNTFLLFLQRLWITANLYNRNKLMNHAAACAYGLLLSAAPALLFLSFVVSNALSAAPELVESLIGQMGQVFGIFEIAELFNNFLNSAGSGLAGFISIFTTIFAIRFCAISVQRGLGSVFPGHRSMLRENAVTLGFGLFTMGILFIALLWIRSVINLINLSGFRSFKIFTPLFSNFRITLLISLALLTLAAYRFIPVKPPKIKYIIFGALVCIVFYRIFAIGFALLINPERYNLLYGALGRLFLFLVNVYFFFTFFLFGAQMIHVLDTSDALLFTNFRQVHSEGIKQKTIFGRLFFMLPSPLKKYTAFFREGDPIYNLHSPGQEVYYILSGKAGVYLDNDHRSKINTMDEMSFFGETPSADSDKPEGRTASIKAETDLSVLILPPGLFRVIQQIDPKTDRELVRILSERLKSADDQIRVLKTNTRQNQQP